MNPTCLLEAAIESERIDIISIYSTFFYSITERDIGAIFKGHSLIVLIKWSDIFYFHPSDACSITIEYILYSDRSLPSNFRIRSELIWKLVYFSVCSEKNGRLERRGQSFTGMSCTHSTRQRTAFMCTMAAIEASALLGLLSVVEISALWNLLADKEVSSL